ncbi:hypothetical protein J9174_08020 [Macrococcoides canis]|uniref:hypothetical protein n=1 Tax=Macrococcoides canis TaxID=1855823 RepID=UPI001AEC4CA1|nr:hypothetical protein [Macrococcus canis]QTQ07377.1 hypothetical protein J9174_08020 [Macrococcus canis]
MIKKKIITSICTFTLLYTVQANAQTVNTQSLQTVKTNLETHHENIKTEVNTVKENIANKKESVEKIEKKVEQLPQEVTTKIKDNQVENQLIPEQKLNTYIQLQTLKEKQELSELEYKTEVLKIVNKTLSHYLSNHDKNHFDFEALKLQGFDKSVLSSYHKKLLSDLEKLKLDGKISNETYNHKVFDILHEHLQNGNEKLVHVNNKLSEHQVKDNLAEGFISNLSTPVKTESKNVQPTSTSTKTLPELGEAQNKPLMITAVIILIIGGFILFRSRKK